MVIKKYLKDSNRSILLLVIISVLFCIIYSMAIAGCIAVYNISNSSNNINLDKLSTQSNTLSNLSVELEKIIIKDTFVDEQIVQDLYQILKDTTEVLNYANITYSACCGTVLGISRSQGLIPWDDDIDLLIFHKDELKLKELRPVFAKLGYQLINPNTYSVCKVKDKLLYPCVELFIINEDQVTNKITYSNWNVQDQYPNEWFFKNKFFPLKLYKFGPLQIYGPNDPAWYLHNVYGPFWKTVANIKPKHYNSKHTANISIKLSTELNNKFKQPSLPKFLLLDRVTPADIPLHLQK